MKRSVRYPLILAILLPLVLSVVISCVPQKKIKYLQRTQKNDTNSVYINSFAVTYQIQPHDNLYIRIVSLDDKTYQFFNSVSGGNGSEANASDLYLNSYSVNDSGYIEIPLLKKIFVRGLTVEQVKSQLQILVNQYLKETLVIVKLVNYNISVVGEVKAPGQYPVNQDKITIFEAISKAGDLTDFANRSKVALIRQTNNGSKVYYIDLTKIDVLSNSLYYLQPKDIIYVSPLGVKQWGSSTFPWGLAFSSISLILSLYLFFKK
ncbi:MAG: polysaccharide biosynthesis/export family protein [Bacteroidota bacterium]|nr:polysaccharide biosynthesis/export family protein [Bacteroidota bacterium]